MGQRDSISELRALILELRDSYAVNSWRAYWPDKSLIEANELATYCDKIYLAQTHDAPLVLQELAEACGVSPAMLESKIAELIARKFVRRDAQGQLFFVDEAMAPMHRHSNLFTNAHLTVMAGQRIAEWLLRHPHAYQAEQPRRLAPRDGR